MFTLPCYSTVGKSLQWLLHVSKGYHFSTSFNEGPSKPEGFGRGDVATSKALTGNRKGCQVCLERQSSDFFFCHGQSPKSNVICLWWFVKVSLQMLAHRYTSMAKKIYIYIYNIVLLFRVDSTHGLMVAEPV